MVYKDPYEQALKPVPYKDDPPWLPFGGMLFQSFPWPWKKNYTGRKEWWGEMGYKNEYVQRGILETARPHCREVDECWWNPKVPDGTSIGGALGQDSIYHRDYSHKADQTGNFFDFQKKIMTSSAQYKQIAEKWDLSKEHPGVHVNPRLESMEYFTKYSLGKGDLPNLYHFGPRFFDKPMNEGCIEKGICLCKYATVYGVIRTISELKGLGLLKREQYSIRNFIKFLVPKLPVPNAMAFTFGVSACTASHFRHVDDGWNWTLASAATSIAHYSIRNNGPFAGSIFVIGSLAGGVIQYFRVTRLGLSYHVVHQEVGGYHMSGPHSWKFLDFGSAKVPTTKY